MKGETSMCFPNPIALALVLLLAVAPVGAEASFDGDLSAVMKEWAHIKYELPEAGQEAAYEALASRATALARRHPDRAEPKIWEAIVRGSLAGSMGGVRALFSALPEAKKARDLLLEAEAIDPQALDGSVYTSLGSLYYQVPGSPIGFGDPQRALVYLERATSISPDGIDANFFMGDYCLPPGDEPPARRSPARALAARARPPGPLADAGRRRSIRVALEALAN
jgi:tetratricopeptide (TPR) repeat protein